MNTIHGNKFKINTHSWSVLKSLKLNNMKIRISLFFYNVVKLYPCCVMKFLPFLHSFDIVFQVSCQDYEVGDIECSFGELSTNSNSRVNQRLTAKLKKPVGFKGTPIFADDRNVDPLTDKVKKTNNLCCCFNMNETKSLFLSAGVSNSTRGQ